MSPVIHFDLFHRYWTRRSLQLIPFKQRGFFDLPIIQGSNFSDPSALQVRASVIRSLLFFPPLPAFVVSVRSGVSFQKRAVSSMLRTLQGLYSEATDRILSICSIALKLSISADAASPCSMYSLILNRLLNPSSQPFENRGSSLPLYCGRLSHNLLAWFRRISPVITAFCFCICCCYSNNAPSRSGQSPADVLFASSCDLSFFVSAESRCSNFLEIIFDICD